MRSEYLPLADDVDAALRQDVLEKWFPAAVDPRGGFFQDFAEDWSRAEDSGARGIVYQSRLTWTAAAVGDVAAARHGLTFLRERLWDRERGGFCWDAGDAAGEKHAYGIAFGIYAAAACHRATRDPAALDLARTAFAWLDRHAHDASHGGYAEALSADGTPIAGPRRGWDAIGTRYGLKSANTHIHLLEAFSALHIVWPDPVLRERLADVFGIVRDRICLPEGRLRLFFRPDWRAVPGPESCGHALETAHLLHAAAQALGEDATAVSRALVDHALATGRDSLHGGFRDESGAKIWWVQAEALNALLLMHALHGEETPRYRDAFLDTWEFVRTQQRDPVHGGWHRAVGADGQPLTRLKSDAWTDPYHQTRALQTIAATLRRLAG